MKRRILALSLAAAMVVGALASCTTKTEEVSSVVETRDVKLTLWGSEQDQAFPGVPDLAALLYSAFPQFYSRCADSDDPAVRVYILSGFPRTEADDSGCTRNAADANHKRIPFGQPDGNKCGKRLFPENRTAVFRLIHTGFLQRTGQFLLFVR